MKRLQKGGARVVLSFAVAFILHGIAAAGALGPVQPGWAPDGEKYNSNALWVAITGISNNAAFLAINVPGTIPSNVCSLFFVPSLNDNQEWSRIIPCAPGRTNLVVTNLPAAQGFFMLSSPIRLGFDQQTLDRNDDGSTGLVPLPFTINFLNNSESALYVNNNGNVTFDQASYYYTPGNLASTKVKMIAPFWADVDTRSPSPGAVEYGTNNVDGHSAFGVDWVNVGYYATHANKLLSCQLVMIDRSDNAPGDFDMEFNYSQVQWEAGSASGGSNGLGGYSARAGYSDGITAYELSGSGVNGAFLDTNTVTGLIYNCLRSSIPGRYVFLFRDGQPLP